jgi:hypothetical protein
MHARAHTHTPYTHALTHREAHRKHVWAPICDGMLTQQSKPKRAVPPPETSM